MGHATSIRPTGCVRRRSCGRVAVAAIAPCPGCQRRMKSDPHSAREWGELHPRAARLNVAPSSPPQTRRRRLVRVARRKGPARRAATATSLAERRAGGACARPGQALLRAAPAHLAQQPIDRRWADRQQQATHFIADRDAAMSLERGQQHRNQRLKTLRADPVGRLPQRDQRGHRRRNAGGLGVPLRRYRFPITTTNSVQGGWAKRHRGASCCTAQYSCARTSCTL